MYKLFDELFNQIKTVKHPEDISAILKPWTLELLVPNSYYKARGIISHEDKLFSKFLDIAIDGTLDGRLYIIQKGLGLLLDPGTGRYFRLTKPINEGMYDALRTAGPKDLFTDTNELGKILGEILGNNLLEILDVMDYRNFDPSKLDFEKSDLGWKSARAGLPGGINTTYIIKNNTIV